MAERAPYSPVAGTGWLEGWRLTFGGEEHSWEGPLTMVVEEPGATVFVVLYDMHALDEASLDAWEGVALGLWSKIRVRVQTLEGNLLAWLYVLDAYEGGLPTADYLTMIADAATYIFFNHTRWSNAFADNVYGVCNGVLPDGSTARCTSNGAGRLNQIWLQ